MSKKEHKIEKGQTALPNEGGWRVAIARVGQHMYDTRQKFIAHGRATHMDKAHDVRHHMHCMKMVGHHATWGKAACRRR